MRQVEVYQWHVEYATHRLITREPALTMASVGPLLEQLKGANVVSVAVSTVMRLRCIIREAVQMIPTV